MTREELLKVAKPMMVNLEVAKTIPNKTQTRRLIKNIKNDFLCPIDMNNIDNFISKKIIGEIPKWRAGDILWVREPVEITAISDTGNYGGSYQDSVYIDFKYASDGKEVFNFELPSEFWMKSWVKVGNRVSNGCLKEMARIFLKVTDIRVERLQDITDIDIESEGISEENRTYHIENTESGKIIKFPIDAWRDLWNSTAPKGYKWEDNPYVFVYEFEKVEVSG